jgi:serine/threonine-protein kinase RsbW
VSGHATRRLSLRNDSGELLRIHPQVRRFLEEESATAKAAYAVELALEEIVTNIIRHGLLGDAAREIAVELTADRDDLILRFADDGVAFDPREHEVEPPGLRSGGFGIGLVREFSRRMDYRREAGRNHLEVRIAR